MGPCALGAAFSPRVNDLVVAIDRGLHTAIQSKWHVSVAVGDWDSLPKRYGKNPKGPWLTLTLPRKKDRSDTCFAAGVLAAIQPARCEEWVCVGLNGGRVDHELAVWLDLSNALRSNRSLKRITFLGKEPRWILGPGKHWLELRGGFSLFSILGAKGVRIRGADYGRKTFDLPPSSLGLSNRALGASVEVSIQRGIVLVIGFR